jgi:hypothetical protein
MMDALETLLPLSARLLQHVCVGARVECAIEIRLHRI